MKKSVLVLIIIGVVFVSGCVQQDGDGTGNGQNGDGAIMPADLTQITFLEDLAADPSWSPDGSQIIFLGMGKNTPEGGFYVINSDGTGVAKIGSWGYDHLFNPSWSPVSNKIIGHGTDDEHHPHGLFLIDLDGDPTEQIQLTTQKSEMPSWSPDGTRIAYNVYSGDWSSSKYGYESSSIWIMDVNGSGQTQLTTEEDGFCTAPSFSYDGSKIVYLKGFTSYMPEAKSAQQEPNEIWVMNSDGSNKHVIFAPGDGSTQNIRERAWNKNDEIIFSRFWHQQVTQIWVINSNGTNPRSILKPAETFSSDVVVYDDPVWDNSGTKVALTEVTSPAMPEESWQIATFSWEDGGEAEAANWTFEGLCISGEIVDHEVFQLPDGSYAMHTCGLGKVAYSPDGLTWTISEDDVIGEGSSILKLPNGGYRAWWSVSKGAETFDMLTAFSSDGYNWEEPTMLTSSNMEDFYGALPVVVISPDGTYRMYYTRTGPETYTLPEKDSEADVRRIYSAHSSDGLFWEPDPGIRIDGAEESDKGHASSNDVYIREDGKYGMVYTGEGGRGISYAVSNDGLSWTRLGFTGFLGMDPVINVFPDGTVRMYYDNYITHQSKDKNKDTSGLLYTLDGRPPGVYSAVRESEGKSGETNGENSLSVDFQFARKIEIDDVQLYPPIIFTNNHFYVSHESDELIYVRIYNENFTSTGEEHQLTDERSGDHQMVFADNYFYLVYIGNDNYLHLKKFDSNWNEIKKVAVNEQSPDMEQESACDFLLYYTDGFLYIGTVVEEPLEEGEIPGDNNGLHMRIFDTNLEFQDEFYLSDEGGGFGSGMILQNETFILVSAKKFEDVFGSLIILRYDEDWNFIDEKRISFPEAGGFSNEHMVRGVIFENGCYFISYTDPTEKSTEIGDYGDITLKAFDLEWNLVGEVKVTDDILPNKANRAHLAFAGNKIYVAYDVLEEGLPYEEGFVSKIFVKEYDVIIND